MPAAVIAWLMSHQAVAAALATWFGLAAAGIDVTSKAVDLERKLQQHVEQHEQE